MTLLPGIDPFPQDPAARVKASSAWYTPPEAARVLAAMAYSAAPRVHRHDPWRVLEPSAGGGALIDAWCDSVQPSPDTAIDAVDLDIHTVERLQARRWPCQVRVEHADYLSRKAPDRVYDLTIQNPPYEDGLDSQFLAKAMDESLRVVALVRLAILESQRSHARVWSRVATEEHPDREWRLLEARFFVSRPVFLAGGESSDGGKTAFMAVKLSRVPGEARGTSVEWVR